LLHVGLEDARFSYRKGRRGGTWTERVAL
jgi:hypothetical protein